MEKCCQRVCKLNVSEGNGGVLLTMIMLHKRHVFIHYFICRLLSETNSPLLN